MSRGPHWNDEEINFINGVLNTHGEDPAKWNEEVRAMVKANLARRSETGIYQMALKIVRARKAMPIQPMNLAKGA